MSDEPPAQDTEAERARFRKEMQRIEALLLSEASLAFTRKELLHRAFQHRSYIQANDRAVSYERLEFLGDRVLELYMAEWLYQRDPDADEGTLSKDLAWRVDEVNLARAGERLQVKRALRLSTSIDRQEVSDKIVADVVEALVGAIYLDVGLDAARRFIEAFIPLQGEPPAEFHSTNELFERCISLGLSPPQFIEVAEGPDNKATWRVECVVGERRTLGRAKRKRDARKEACQAMLLLLSGD